MSGHYTFFFPALEEYYNTGFEKTAFITMDVDWAPDPILEWTFKWLLNHDIAFTAFMTHDSEVAGSYEDHPLVEIGIHPDFSRDNNALAHVQRLREIYPRSIGSRSHRNICGRDVTDALRACGYVYDVSKLLWGTSYAECTPLYNGMVEAPYIWEDGVHLEMKVAPDISVIPLATPGLKILNIHPMPFYLNCTSDEQRKAVTSCYTDLTSASLEHIEAARNSGRGIAAFAREMSLHIRNSGFRFCLLREMMAEAYQLCQARRVFEWPCRWYCSIGMEDMPRRKATSEG